MSPRLSPEARALLAAQLGFIADWQGQFVGLDRRRLMRATGAGWRHATEHVFAAHDLPVTDAHQRIIGVLEAGPSAVLAGRSALHHAGWKGRESGSVDIYLPRANRWQSRSPVPWLRLHFPTAIPRAIGEPPRTPAARAALDAAAWSSTPREALMILLSSAQQRLVLPDQLHRELQRSGRIRHRRAITDAIAQLHEGATSSNEADFLRECRRRGLPAPRMQTRRRAGARIRVTDAEFPLADGRVLIVEVDGIGHLEANSWHADIVRHNELALSTGATILRITGWELRNDPDPFFELLGSAIDLAA